MKNKVSIKTIRLYLKTFNKIEKIKNTFSYKSYDETLNKFCDFFIENAIKLFTLLN